MYAHLQHRQREEYTKPKTNQTEEEEKRTKKKTKHQRLERNVKFVNEIANLNSQNHTLEMV